MIKYNLGTWTCLPVGTHTCMHTFTFHIYQNSNFEWTLPYLKAGHINLTVKVVSEKE